MPPKRRLSRPGGSVEMDESLDHYVSEQQLHEPSDFVPSPPRTSRPGTGRITKRRSWNSTPPRLLSSGTTRPTPSRSGTSRPRVPGSGATRAGTSDSRRPGTRYQTAQDLLPSSFWGENQHDPFNDRLQFEDREANWILDGQRQFWKRDQGEADRAQALNDLDSFNKLTDAMEEEGQTRILEQTAGNKQRLKTLLDQSDIY